MLQRTALSQHPAVLEPVRRPPLGLLFHSFPWGERVSVEGTTVVYYTVDLSKVPKGELRELARAGFRQQCLARTSTIRAERDGRLAANVLANFVERINEDKGED